MKVLVINPIMYTSETKNIKRADSIKDTMMYDFCLAFHEMGHEITLAAAEPFKPYQEEMYPFTVLWWNCRCQKIFLPHCLPYMPITRKFVKEHRNEYDLIISSEVFSVNSLMAYRAAPDKVIIWHELAKHNSIFKQIPSRVWYGMIARFFMRNAKIVARSVEAKKFIEQYCHNVASYVIDHGVNLDKFRPDTEHKEKSFAVCSQLIERKKIDGIIDKFAEFLSKYDPEFTLYIIGGGELEKTLKKQVSSLNIAENVQFEGQMTHDELMPVLARAKAMLVNTVKDNNMVSIVESIAVGTPIVTTDIPLNSTYIKKYELGIVRRQWTADDLQDVVCNNSFYIKNCMDYRYRLSTKRRVEQFIELSQNFTSDSMK